MNLIAKVAVSKHDLDITYHIRYKVFIEELKFMPASHFPDKKEKDAYDDLDTTIHFLVVHGNTGLATARLIGPNKKNISSKKSIFGLPMEDIYDLSSYKSKKIIPYEISRSSVIKNERSSRAILDIWRICVQYGQMNNISMLCTCAGTETDCYEDAKIIYILLKHKNYLHPEIVTKPFHEICPDFTPRYRLYPQKIKNRILKKDRVDPDEIKEYEKKGLQLPSSLKYFIRLGGKATGPPTLFPKFRMFTIPMVFDIDNLNEPFQTFFKRNNCFVQVENKQSACV